MERPFFFMSSSLGSSSYSPGGCKDTCGPWPGLGALIWSDCSGTSQGLAKWGAEAAELRPTSWPAYVHPVTSQCGPRLDVRHIWTRTQGWLR